MNPSCHDNAPKKRLLLFALLFIQCLTATPGATFNITPSTVNNQFGGSITLDINGLGAGETNVVQKFLDANHNGVIDSADLLIQQFQLIDGQTSIIGGVTNLATPSDLNPIDGAISATLNLQNGNLPFVAQYAFKISSPTGKFVPVTNLFNITNQPFSQAITGNVISGGTNVPNAFITLFAPQGDTLNAVLGTIADNSGKFALQSPSGTYVAAAVKPNFVTDTSTLPKITLNRGSAITTNFALIPATRIISGRVIDANNSSSGLPGMQVIAQSDNGLLGIGFTDTNGSFNVGVTAGQWSLKLQSADVALQGFVELQNQPAADTTAGNVTGVTFVLPRANAMIYGSVRTDQGQPLSNVSLSGSDSNGLYQDNAVYTDQNGNYFSLAVAGNWQLSPDTNSATLNNYTVSQGLGLVHLNAGRALLQNFTAVSVSNHISGFVRDSHNAPIAGVQVNASANINGVPYQTQILTDASGNYSLNTANGVWTVAVSCQGSDFSLSNFGNYQCPANQDITVASGNGVANFIVLPCGSVQITTTSLPDGQIGADYNVQLQALSCQPIFNWSLSPGSASLPTGLTLHANGVIDGAPQSSGLFKFTARVNDGNGTGADQSLSILVSGTQLAITTTNLPPGSVGSPYGATLLAIGGQQPYSWSTSPGSAPLPPGLTMAPNGAISGTPTSNGSFTFIIRVTDAASNSADHVLSLAIAGTAQPPRMGATLLSDHSFQMTLTGDPARTYIIQTTTDLNSWTDLFTTNAPSGTVRLLGIQPAGSRQFYRAKQAN